MTGAPSRGRRAAPVAVVGAGVAGLSCATLLEAQGWPCAVFEAGPAPGGRLASQTTDFGVADFGAQYLTVQSEAFAQEIHRWVRADQVRTWDARFAELSGGQNTVLPAGPPRFVGIPSMQSVAHFMARHLHVHTGVRVGRIQREQGLWQLFDPEDHAVDDGRRFEVLVLALPSGTAARLAQGWTPLVQEFEGVAWESCWSAALALGRGSGIDFDAAFIGDDPILSWVARDSGKPLRGTPRGVTERWLLHARPGWSATHGDMPREEAARWMQRAFAARLGRPLAQAACTAGFWRQAAPRETLACGHLWDPDCALGFAGDWCLGARVEAAFLSGQGLAKAISAAGPHKMAA